MTRIYEKDPGAIYRQSLEIVCSEADLSRFDEEEALVAARVIHACGTVGIADDLRFSEGAVARGIAAMESGALIISDCEMVAAGISLAASHLTNSVICLLNDPKVAPRAKAESTTRSAAQVPFWHDLQEGSVIAIGNAPTALFHLIEEIDSGAPLPAIVLGFPVGFVGSVESKQALVESNPAIPHAALLGRRGGSAMAAAAVNALARLASGKVYE